MLGAIFCFFSCQIHEIQQTLFEYICVIDSLDLHILEELNSAQGLFSSDVLLTALSGRLCLAMASAQHQWCLPFNLLTDITGVGIAVFMSYELHCRVAKRADMARNP